MTEANAQPDVRDGDAEPTIDERDDRTASKKFIVMTVAIAAVLVLVLGIAMTRLLGNGQESSPTSGQDASPTSGQVGATQSATAAEGSICGLDTVDMTGTVASGPTAKWALIGATMAPSIEGQGPGKVEDDGMRYCYARTPTGALLAISNYVAIASQPGAEQRQVVERLTVPGPGRDAALAAPTAEYEESDLKPQISGFRVTRYDGDTAHIELVVSFLQQGLYVSGYTLKWVNGDWKLALTKNGQTAPLTEIPSLSGYVPWSSSGE